MPVSPTEIESAVAPLLSADEDQLYAELGIRARALALDPAVAGEFDPHVQYSEAEMGVLDDVRAFGQRLFRRWNRELNGLICGADPDDAAERKKLADTIGLGETAVAAFVATLIVSSLGLAPAIAAVVAAIVVKRFLRPTLEELCVVWGESLI